MYVDIGQGKTLYLSAGVSCVSERKIPERVHPPWQRASPAISSPRPQHSTPAG